MILWYCSTNQHILSIKSLNKFLKCYKRWTWTSRSRIDISIILIPWRVLRYIRTYKGNLPCIKIIYLKCSMLEHNCFLFLKYFNVCYAICNTSFVYISWLAWNLQLPCETCVSQRCNQNMSPNQAKEIYDMNLVALHFTLNRMCWKTKCDW